jgi:hypothetical protein
LIGAAWIESNFCVARHVQIAAPVSMVGQRDPTDLRVCIGNDRDLITGLDLSVAAPKGGAVRSQLRSVLIAAAA